MFIFQFFVFGVIGRYLTSLLISNAIVVILGIANQMKVIERNEYISFKELGVIKNVSFLWNYVDFKMVFAIVLCLLIISLLFFFESKVMKDLKVFPGLLERASLFIVSTLLLGGVLTFPNQYNEKVLKWVNFNGPNHSPVSRAIRLGYIPTFLSTVSPEYMGQPDSYNSKEMEKIAKRYQDLAVEYNKTHKNNFSDDDTIIYLSESLWEASPLSKKYQVADPIPNIHGLAKNNGGQMISHFVGGGTANVEYSVLTSMSLELNNNPIAVTPFVEYIEHSPDKSSIISFSKNPGTGIHPFNYRLYNREGAYGVLGIDNLYDLSNGLKKGSDELAKFTKNTSDKTLNTSLKAILEKNEGSVYNVLSMQNHSPYSDSPAPYGKGFKLSTQFFEAIAQSQNKSVQNQFNTYFLNLGYTDQAVKDLIADLDAREKNTNIIFYGDHGPNLLNKTKTVFTKEEIEATPYFIYLNNNRMAKAEKAPSDKQSPIFLVPKLLKEGDYKVSGFYYLMIALLESNVSEIGSDYVIFEGKKTKLPDLPADIQELVKDYELIVYDKSFGKNYVATDLYNKIN